jgi:hypothetical protein
MSELSGTERRRAPRARMSLPCTLRRRPSSPIWAETIDLGPGGMSVRATRPLRPDEVVEFDLVRGDDSHIEGRARVMRHNGPRAYGLRFESLPGPMRERLLELVHEFAR